MGGEGAQTGHGHWAVSNPQSSGWVDLIQAIPGHMVLQLPFCCTGPSSPIVLAEAYPMGRGKYPLVPC